MLDALPNELVSRITSFIGGDHLVAAAHACTALRTSIPKDELAYAVARRKLRAIIRNMDKTDLYERVLGPIASPAALKVPDAPSTGRKIIDLGGGVTFSLSVGWRMISVIDTVTVEEATDDAYRAAAAYFHKHLTPSLQDGPVFGPLDVCGAAKAKVMYVWTLGADNQLIRQLFFKTEASPGRGYLLCTSQSAIVKGLSWPDFDVSHYAIDTIARAVMLLPTIRAFLDPFDDDEFFELDRSV